MLLLEILKFILHFFSFAMLDLFVHLFVLVFAGWMDNCDALFVCAEMVFESACICMFMRWTRVDVCFSVCIT